MLNSCFEEGDRGPNARHLFVIKPNITTRITYTKIITNHMLKDGGDEEN